MTLCTFLVAHCSLIQLVKDMHVLRLASLLASSSAEHWHSVPFPNLSKQSIMHQAAKLNTSFARCRGEGQEQASSSRSAATQPIDMSMRAEHNKVRTHLVGPKKDRSSPYGTPAAKSPLSSPLIADAAALEALNLNPGSAK